MSGVERIVKRSERAQLVDGDCTGNDRGTMVSGLVIVIAVLVSAVCCLLVTLSAMMAWQW
jgi:hypothetical protein